MSLELVKNNPNQSRLQKPFKAFGNFILKAFHRTESIPDRGADVMVPYEDEMWFREEFDRFANSGSLPAEPANVVNVDFKKKRRAS